MLDSVLTLSEQRLGVMQPRPLDTLHIGGAIRSDGAITAPSLSTTGNISVGGTLSTATLSVTNSLGVGVNPPQAQLHVKGGSYTSWPSNTSPTAFASTGGMIVVNDTNSAGYNGGILFFGDASHIAIAGIKSWLLDGTANGIGYISIGTRRSTGAASFVDGFTLDYNGTVGMPGTVNTGAISSSSTITSTGRIQAGTDLYVVNSYIYYGPSNHIHSSGNDLYHRSISGWHYMQTLAGAGGVLVVGQANLNKVYYPNGYYIDYVSGQTALFTNGNWVVQGGYIYLNGDRTLQIAHVGGNYIQANHHMGAVGAADYGWGFQLPNSHGISEYTKGLSTGWGIHSSRDYKRDIRPLHDPLSLVLNPKLHGIAYSHIHRVGDEEKLEPSIGFVADEWLPYVPEIVGLNADGKPIAMDYARVGAITFEALKQLALRVKELEDAR